MLSPELFVALGSNVLTDANTGTTNTLNYPKLMNDLSGPVTNVTAIGNSNAVLKIMTAGPVANVSTDVPTSFLLLLGSHGPAITKAVSPRLRPARRVPTTKASRGTPQLASRQVILTLMERSTSSTVVFSRPIGT